MLESSRRAWARVPLRARLLLLLVAGRLAVQAASLWWALSDRAVGARRAALVQQVQRAADVVAVIEAAPPPQRAAVAAALPYPVVRLDRTAPAQAAPPEVLAVVRDVWNQRLPGRAVSIVATRGPLQRARDPARPDGLRIVLATSLRDGQTVEVEVEVGQPRFRTEGLLGPFLLLGAVTSLLVMVAMRWALRPLEQRARGADALGAGLDAAPLAEQGPPEVRQSAEVLNRLHARLKEHVQGRVQALAAISHDLRTPITRLRLRAELLADPDSRTSFARDPRQLEDMVQGTLDYLRGIGEAPPLEPVDLDGLLAQAVEDVEALGGQVVGPEPTGLVVRVHVQDRGPGIPDSEIGRVLQPFEQLDRSRGGSSGAGLGLSIANEVALRHDGRLLISNRAGGGLCATLELAAA